jgi:hypothetical protein
MQQMPRPAALSEIARVFDKRIQRFRELPIQKERGFAGQIASVSLGGPVERQLSCRGPIVGELSRPGQLQPRIVSMARYRGRARGQAHEGDQRHIESAGWAELLLHPDGEIAEPRAAVSRIDRVKIVGHRKAQLRAAADAKTHQGLGAVEDVLPLSAGDDEPVLELDTPLRDHDARIGDRRPVGGDRLTAWRRALAVKKNGSANKGKQTSAGDAFEQDNAAIDRGLSRGDRAGCDVLIHVSGLDRRRFLAIHLGVWIDEVIQRVALLPGRENQIAAL